MNSEQTVFEMRKKLKVELDRFIEILHDLYEFYLDASQGFGLIEKQAKKNPPLLKRIFANAPPDNPDAIILNSSTWDEIRQSNWLQWRTKEGPIRTFSLINYKVKVYCNLSPCTHKILHAKTKKLIENGNLVRNRAYYLAHSNIETFSRIKFEIEFV